MVEFWYNINTRFLIFSFDYTANELFSSLEVVKMASLALVSNFLTFIHIFLTSPCLSSI